MSLETGKYIITNKMTNGGVGPHGDGPVTKVVLLPDGVKAPSWKLTKIEGSCYEITQDGRVAIEQEGGLVLSGEDDEKPVWRLESVPQQGENAYTIVEARGYLGWAAPSEEPYTQVAVRHLIVHPTYPPRYPLFELFDIVKDDGDDAN
ncbi:hypothetical protein MD484_g7852, partial [Candolleomyces efflorescens]